MAGITIRTLGSIERGDVVGQAGVIQRLKNALGLADPEPEAYDDQVQTLVAMIGDLLQQVEPEHRPDVMREIIAVLAAALKRPSKIDTSTVTGDVVEIDFGLPEELSREEMSDEIAEYRRQADRRQKREQIAFDRAQGREEHIYWGGETSEGDLRLEPSAAQPKPKRDVEGDSEGESI